ncbi:MAG: heparinase II/III family protein [Gemmatimonadetes bacterium]|nr:heparinase II/III family protein [Gemmatimonadota bacterium]
MNLYTPEQIQLARQRAADEPDAKEVAGRIVEDADPWLERDQDLIHSLMPGPEVPRSWTINFVSGCPVHGSGPNGYGGYAQGGWIHDPFKDQWRVTCAIGGESYPSNDFGAFYRSGMEDRSLLTGPYADDGWGWQGDDTPFRHWFIAYCCCSTWNTVVAGLTSLSQAYLLSGDGRYAHKALVILDRLAEVYPHMDYSRQSMYALEFSPGYTGKMNDLISESGTVRRLCQALDAVRDAIPGDPIFGSDADGIRKKMEDGIIGASLDGIYRGHVRSNYGGHQEALLIAALASGDRNEIDKAVEWTLNNTGEATELKEMLTHFDGYIFRDKAAHAEGINFALDNLIFREGMGWESSPSYNSSWVTHLTVIARLLEEQGIRIWDRPKFRRMYRWAEEMTCLDEFTPCIGDAGTTTGGHVSLDSATLRTAYRATGDAFVGELLRGRETGFDSFESLLEEPVEPPPHADGAAELKEMAAESRLMGGFGLALLRSGRRRERAAVALYYGRAATEHAHFDRLNVELFAYGRKLIPDLGYGEHAAEGDRPAVWTKNTLAHATVVVDGRRQDSQGPGRLEHFVRARGLTWMQVDAPETYHHASEYRRTLALIEIANDARYLLDCFRVEGGSQHDYSLHGFEGEFSVDDITLTPPQKQGTLAGSDVPFGAIYDDAGLTDPLRKGRSYYTYRGGGYSYLYDTRRGNPTASWSSNWRDVKTGIGLSSTFLPSDEAIVAHGDPPRKPGNPKQLTYVLLRNAGDVAASRFVAVHEPFKGTKRVHGVEQLDAGGETLALRVSHRYGEDTIRHAIGPSGGSFGMARHDDEGKLVSLHQSGEGSISADGHTLSIPGPLRGCIVEIDPGSSTITVERDRDSQAFRTAALKGDVARIGNARRGAAYNITAVEGRGRRYRIGFGDDSFRVGRFVITGRNPDGTGLSTKTNLYMAAQGYYRGAWLTDRDHAHWLPVDDVELAPHAPGVRRDAGIRLVGGHDLSAGFGVGDIAYLYDVGPGDTIEITPTATAVRQRDGRFRIRANCRAILD